MNRHVVNALFRLPLDGAHKPLEEVPSKKRAMYRRRYELLESARQGIEGAYAAAAAEGNKSSVRSTSSASTEKSSPT